MTSVNLDFIVRLVWGIKKMAKENMRKFSNRQEKKIARQFEGRQTSNSGAGFIKGDIITRYFLIEAKTTTREIKTFPVKEEWLKKLQQEKFAMSKRHAALAFQFKQGGENYFVINEKAFNDFQRLVNKEEKEG